MIGFDFIQKLGSTTTFARPARWLVNCMTGGQVTSGVHVNEETALNYAACWLATRVIAEGVAGLPCITYERLPNNRGRLRATDHPLYELLHRKPNPDMTAVTFWEMLASWLVNSGAARAEITRYSSGEISALWPIPPDHIEAMRTPDNRLVYEVRGDSGEKRILDAASVFNVPGSLSCDGITGRGVIGQARESIGMGIATEQYGAGFFGNGARPGGILSHPGNPSEDAENRMRASWEAMHRGPKNAQRTALLREGTTYTPIGIPPEDAQFLETRQFNVTEIARWYRVTPHKLMDLSRATFSNIEQQAQDFYSDSIVPWCKKIESACALHLLDDPERYYVEFLVDGALRGDAKSRTESAAQQFLNGALTLNQWCAMENRNAIEGPGGDTHFVPLNMVPLERALEPPEPKTEAAPASKQDAKEKENSKSDKSEDDLRYQVAAEATWAAVKAQVDRLHVKETKAIRRAANQPSTFLDAVEEFYEKHVPLMASAITSALAAHMAVVGDDRDAAECAMRMARQYRDRVLNELLTASECTAAELSEAIQRLTDDWRPEIEEVEYAEAKS